MHTFTLAVADSQNPRPANQTNFMICSKCYTAHHGAIAHLKPCSQCLGGLLMYATPTPNPPPRSLRYMVCDNCGYIISGKRTRKAHHDRCDCRTIHQLFPKGD